MDNVEHSADTRRIAAEAAGVLEDWGKRGLDHLIVGNVKVGFDFDHLRADRQCYRAHCPPGAPSFRLRDVVALSLLHLSSCSLMLFALHV